MRDRFRGERCACRMERLVGKHHEQDLDLFLRHHYLTADLVVPVKRMLAAQAVTSPLLAERRSGCHATAAEFAWKSLTLSNVLVGRHSGRVVADYLKSHGGLAPAQIRSWSSQLKRVLLEVGTARVGE